MSFAVNLQTYKRAPVHFYDPLKAPLLDHYRQVLSKSCLPRLLYDWKPIYRLKVPAIRAVLDYLKCVPITANPMRRPLILPSLSFLLLFILFVLLLETNELDHINIFEWAFMVYAFGVLDQIWLFLVLNQRWYLQASPLIG